MSNLHSVAFEQSRCVECESVVEVLRKLLVLDTFEKVIGPPHDLVRYTRSTVLLTAATLYEGGIVLAARLPTLKRRVEYARLAKEWSANIRYAIAESPAASSEWVHPVLFAMASPSAS